MMETTELITNKGVWLAIHNRGASEFNILEQILYKISHDSADNQLDPVQFVNYYNVKIAQNHTILY